MNIRIHLFPPGIQGHNLHDENNFKLVYIFSNKPFARLRCSRRPPPQKKRVASELGRTTNVRNGADGGVGHGQAVASSWMAGVHCPAH